MLCRTALVAAAALLTICGCSPHRPPIQPAARYATAADVIDGIVFIAGGVERTAEGHAVVASVEAYDPSSGEWTRCAPMAQARVFAAAAAFKGKLYVFGGLDADGKALASVEVYDPRTDTWSPSRPMDRALGRLAAASHMHIGIVVAGGLTDDGTNVADPRIYVPRDRSDWNRWPLLSGGRHGLGLTDADDGTERIFAVGGYDESGPLDRVEWFGVGTVHVRDENGDLRRPGMNTTDPSTHETREITEDYEGHGWWPGPPLHQARGFHGLARIGKLLYAVGGRCREIPPTEVLDIDDLESGWQTAAPLPKDLCRFSMVAWRGRLLVFGGETEFGASVNTDVLEYDPESDRWTVR